MVLDHLHTCKNVCIKKTPSLSAGYLVSGSTVPESRTKKTVTRGSDGSNGGQIWRQTSYRSLRKPLRPQRTTPGEEVAPYFCICLQRNWTACRQDCFCILKRIFFRPDPMPGVQSSIRGTRGRSAGMSLCQTKRIFLSYLMQETGHQTVLFIV